jgi:signal transduction histidine kinase
MKADVASVVIREKADAARVLGNQTGEESLRFERKRADDVIAAERNRADHALLQERGERKEIEAALLLNERRQTDEDLALERQRTDLDLSASASLLATERSAHSDTKTALTTREELMAIVSHDLRNPIGAVSSCAAMLLDGQDLDGELRTWISFIKRNADAALRLIADLLDMERMANGKLMLEQDQCDLGSLVTEAVQSLSVVAAAKSILLRASPVRAPIRLVCDRDRMLQVLSNLIGNAVKFTPEGGSVDVQISSSDVGDVEIAVSDNGPGIAADKVDHIFERFAQIGTKDRRGLGLGLYISKTIVEAHGGKLWVDSVEGEGSKFTLFIPRSFDANSVRNEPTPRQLFRLE